MFNIKRKIRKWVGNVEIRKMDFRNLLMRTETDRTCMRLKACKKEPETCAWIKSFKPNSIFYDIGANVGGYSLIAASLGHKVFAFEPHFANLFSLNHNVILNNLNITILPIALSDKTEVVNFQFSSLDSGTASHYQDKTGHKIMACSLDNLIKEFNLPQPDYLKIDVDGGELKLLEGAKDTISKANSVLIESDNLSAISLFFKDFKWIGTHKRGTSEIYNYIYTK